MSDGDYEFREVSEAADMEIQDLKDEIGILRTEKHADAEAIAHLQAELAQRDAALKAADKLAQSAQSQKDNFVAWAHDSRPQKAVLSLRADDEFDDALQDYLKARGQDAD